MVRITSFQKTLLIMLGVALAIIIPLLIGMMVLRSYINNNTQSIIQGKHELAQRTSTLNALVALRNEYNAYGKPRFNILYNVIPEKDELINISQEFQRMAQREDLGFGFSFQGEEATGDIGLGFVRFSINVTGDTLDNIIGFVEQVKDFRYLTTIENFRTEVKDKEIQATMEGKVYFR